MISYHTKATKNDIATIPDVLAGLTDSYPDFEPWLYNKAIPSLSTKEGVIVIAKQRDEIVGLAMGKNSPTEKKIRCIRVLPRYQSDGVGTELIERMMKELDDDKPLVTVPHDMIHSYSRIFINHFRYALTWVEKGLYKENRLEYIFNG